ncbi:MAG: archease [Deltaproteobacteria bacterium]|nr:archease [Deltaproteobacteria bacterium]
MTKDADQADRPPYRIFEHTADLGVEIYGTDERDLFRNAALALSDIMTDRRRLRGREEREIVAEGGDREEVLVNFLREVLYLYNGEGWLLKECVISEMDGFHLCAVATGEPFAHGRHTMDVEIKAVTYHRVQIQRAAQGWTGRVICDV